ncbi:MAG: PAS domain-containing protein [Rhodobacterales bacterium]|nr:PAS domain-containing protein [Rhodobacterales bacterium]
MARAISDEVTRPADFSETAWADVLTAVDRTYADLVDYQERLEQQNSELEELRRFLASVLGSVSDVMLVTSREGSVQEVNASLLARTGLQRDAATGRAVAELFDPADRKRLLDAMTEVQSRRQPQTIEAGLSTAEGPTPIELNISPRLDDRGRGVGLVLIGRPVGELRQAYQNLGDSHRALQETQSQLVRNEKLAALGRLLAGVAHELNNPISFVYANAHALERYATKFETYFTRVQQGASRAELVALREELNLDRELRNLRDAVQGARDGAERVRDIVEDLRRLSADGSGEMVVFDLVETTRIAATWVLRGAKEAPKVETRGAARLMVRGRPGHIQQVVMNLVQNAVDALKGCEGAAITLTHGCEDGMAVLEVADNGPGVPEGARAEIFDPFFTTKPVGQGTGLGLSISHKIAEEHGGALRLVEGASGAVFRLTLPAEDGQCG